MIYKTIYFFIYWSLVRYEQYLLSSHFPSPSKGARGCTWYIIHQVGVGCCKYFQIVYTIKSTQTVLRHTICEVINYPQNHLEHLCWNSICSCFKYFFAAFTFLHVYKPHHTLYYLHPIHYSNGFSLLCPGKCTI